MPRPEGAQLAALWRAGLREHTATGLTLIDYLTEIRLVHARRLLLSTIEPTSRVAHRVGYHDASTFTALFKQHHHVRPGTYRSTADGILA